MLEALRKSSRRLKEQSTSGQLLVKLNIGQTEQFLIDHLHECLEGPPPLVDIVQVTVSKVNPKPPLAHVSAVVLP